MPEYKLKMHREIKSCEDCPLGREYEPEGEPTGGIGCMVTYNLYMMPSNRPDDCPLKDV